MPDDRHKIERGLFQSTDGQRRITNPCQHNTKPRHRWLIAQRRSSGSGWHMHPDDHATPHDARTYVETRNA